ncbi:uncharacterized protein LOC121736601 [Aricia agestis]|uniref:uncharacterized protein LOC121736601 n=1 Tax=Aricia agestis TaxID=91739 RepID=UPI001C2020A2|nr:uncharacterized protein LOC121736601 [Aricia agestis]
MIAIILGPYTLSWRNFELCKGSKAKNLTEIVVDIQNQGGGDYYGRINFTFFVPSRIDEIKIVVSTIKDNVKSVLWAYNLKDPCQHFLFASVIEKNLNAHNCAVEKGNYFFEINFSELTKSFLGSSFFYGDYIMKATVITKKGNIVCISINMAVEKKGKEAA